MHSTLVIALRTALGARRVGAAEDLPAPLTSDRVRPTTHGIQLGKIVAMVLLPVLLGACGEVWNNPYPASLQGKRVIYDFYPERPKHLDPVQSYIENEADILFQVYEPLYDYDYLVRPYRLRPAAAQAMPTVRYFDAQGHELPTDAPLAQIATSEYEVRLKPGLRFQPHPAFARDAAGQPLYHALDPAQIERMRSPLDLPQAASRELTTADYAYQLKRLARPGLVSPALEIYSQIVGLKELAAQLRDEAKAGKLDPKGWIDLRDYPLNGVETPDEHTLRIRLHGKYPQFIYWLAITFSSPVPWEADRFFSQPGMAKRDFSLDTWPVGNGPFMMTAYDPNREIVLSKNPNWTGDPYPCEGEAQDHAAGLLADCGKPLPLVDEVRLIREGEAIPFWNKFLQGYYDQFNSSRISLANFDGAVQIPAGGNLSATQEMAERGIRLQTEVEPDIRYWSFNMLDPIVGGGPDPASRERARKLRRALAIAIDVEEHLAVFENGLGVAAQGPIPPGIYGYRGGCEGRNPYVYDCVAGQVKRKSLDEARRLLAEAGYPDGRDAHTGAPLVLYFDYSTGRERAEWLIHQLKKLNIQLVPRSSDFNRFQDKVRTGSYQILFWGWNADFPDPENFMFLLTTKHGKVKYGGENHSNYSNPEFDKLYDELRGMDISADRQAVIDRMVDILRNDGPWIYGWHDETFFLRHAWLTNTKPGKIIRAVRKYQRIDPEQRAAYQAKWNRPQIWPLLAFGVFIMAITTFAWRHYRRHENRRAVETVSA